MQRMNIPEPGSGWPFVNASWINTVGESGSNPNPDEGRSSTSPSPSEEKATANRPYLILVIEDNVGDVFLIREAIQISGIKARAEIVKDGEKAIAYFDKVDSD